MVHMIATNVRYVCDYDCMFAMSLALCVCEYVPWSVKNAGKLQMFIKIKLFADFDSNIYVHCTCICCVPLCM